MEKHGVLFLSKEADSRLRQCKRSLREFSHGQMMDRVQFLACTDPEIDSVAMQSFMQNLRMSEEAVLRFPIYVVIEDSLLTLSEEQATYCLQYQDDLPALLQLAPVQEVYSLLNSIVDQAPDGFKILRVFLFFHAASISSKVLFRLVQNLFADKAIGDKRLFMVGDTWPSGGLVSNVEEKWKGIFFNYLLLALYKQRFMVSTVDKNEVFGLAYKELDKGSLEVQAILNNALYKRMETLASAFFADTRQIWNQYFEEKLGSFESFAAGKEHLIPHAMHAFDAKILRANLEEYLDYAKGLGEIEGQLWKLVEANIHFDLDTYLRDAESILENLEKNTKLLLSNQMFRNLLLNLKSHLQGMQYSRNIVKEEPKGVIKVFFNKKTFAEEILDIVAKNVCVKQSKDCREALCKLLEEKAEKITGKGDALYKKLLSDRQFDRYREFQNRVEVLAAKFNPQNYFSLEELLQQFRKYLFENSLDARHIAILKDEIKGDMHLANYIENEVSSIVYQLRNFVSIGEQSYYLVDEEIAPYFMDIHNDSKQVLDNDNFVKLVYAPIQPFQSEEEKARADTREALWSAIARDCFENQLQRLPEKEQEQSVIAEEDAEEELQEREQPFYFERVANVDGIELRFAKWPDEQPELIYFRFIDAKTDGEYDFLQRLSHTVYIGQGGLRVGTNIQHMMGEIDLHIWYQVDNVKYIHKTRLQATTESIQYRRHQDALEIVSKGKPYSKLLLRIGSVNWPILSGTIEGGKILLKDASRFSLVVKENYSKELEIN